MSAREHGFTLLEALVALAIVAIAAAGLVRAIEGHVDGIRALEQRTAARYVAENRLAELSLGGEHAEAGGEVEMLGSKWQVATAERASADPELRLVEVAVGPTGSKPLVRLTGFIDRGMR